MATRKIAIKEGLDTLRWGHRIRGMFTIGEGYEIKTRHNIHPETNKQKRESIRKTKTWPKIAFFP